MRMGGSLRPFFMKQNLAFFLLALSILVAMAGGTFLYRKAFVKEKLYYKLTDLKIICQDDKFTASVAFDPYIDIYSKDGELVKRDAEPREAFVTKDSIISLRFFLQHGTSWKDVSEAAMTSIEEVDAGSGQKKITPLNTEQWRKKYNAHPSSTMFNKRMLSFTFPSDSSLRKVALYIKMSGSVEITDTCVVR